MASGAVDSSHGRTGVAVTRRPGRCPAGPSRMCGSGLVYAERGRHVDATLAVERVGALLAEVIGALDDRILAAAPDRSPLHSRGTRRAP